MLARILARIVDVRPDESERVGRMFLLLGLIIATSYVLKPLRSSLFLSQFGSERLPYVYMSVAVVMAVVAAGFAKWAPEANLQRLFSRSAYTFSALLIVFWAAAALDWMLTGFAFYLFVSVFTALMPSLFWLLANYVFYSNEGRRLFPVVMAGGLLGSILGGASTSLLVPFVGTEGLFPVAALLLVVIAFVIRRNTSREQERMSERRAELTRQEKRRALREEDRPWTLVARSRYLSLIAALILLTSLTSTLIDFQFNSVVERAFETRDALTRFFGSFFAFINVVAFLLQLLAAGRLLNRLGVGAGLLILPLALLSSSVAFVLVPALLTAALIKTSDDGLSNSINKASVEVLYLPIALAVKNRLKAWLDMFVERVSRGLGGLLILGVSSLLALGVEQMSFVVMALLVPWIVVVLMLQREYVQTFRDSLARRDITDFASSLRDPASRAVFRQVLDGADDRELPYALELLRGTDDAELIDRAVALTSHEEPAVRVAALRLLRGVAEPPQISNLAERVRDRDPSVGGEALALLNRVDPVGALRAFESLIEARDRERIEAVLDCLEASDESLDETVVARIVHQHRGDESPAGRRLAARGIGFLDAGDDAVEFLPALLQDADADVARAAASSAGRLRYEAALPHLIEQLRQRPLRVDSRRALARFGPACIETLETLLRDDSREPELRVTLPRALAEFSDQKAADALLSFLPHEDHRLHYQAVKALAILRANNTSISFHRSEVDRILERERRQLAELARLLTGASERPPEHGSQRLLAEVLEERLGFTRERIFRLLGLVYAQDAIYSAWDRIAHGRPPVRAAALEYLANAFSKKHRGVLFPLLEAADWRELQRRGERLLAASALGFEESLRRLIHVGDHWLAACAVTAVGDLELSDFREELRDMSTHPSPIVKEAVARSVDLLSSASAS